MDIIKVILLMLRTQWNYCAFGDLLLLCNNWDGVISCNSAAEVLVSEVPVTLILIKCMQLNNLERLAVS